MKNLKNIIIGICILSSIVVTGCSSDSKESSKENTKQEQQYAEEENVKLNDKEKKAVKSICDTIKEFAEGKITRSEMIDKVKNEGEATKKDGSRFKTYFEIPANIENDDFKTAIEKMVTLADMLNGKPVLKMDELKIAEEKKDEVKVQSNDGCPVCGGNCPKDSECLKYSPGTCAACGKSGTVNKDLVEWTNNHGEHMTTHKGHCTDIMKEEDNAHTVQTFHCEFCGRAVQATPAEWTGACEYCEMNKSGNPNEVKCPNCGHLLAPNGKCADCGYGY
ncbi:MAG: hypothetical protein E7E58_04860 [Paeniclostridium sordellii]|nr:hypothetical protein [Paeniclostridium sordellii]